MQTASELPGGHPLWPGPQPAAPKKPPTMAELGLNRAERRRLARSRPKHSNRTKGRHP